MLSEAQLRQFHSLGYTLSDKLIEDDALDRALAEIEALQASDRPKMMRGNNPFLGALEREFPWAIEMISCKPVLDIAMQVLGPDVDLFSGSQIAYKQAQSGSSFAWHQDAGYNYIEPQTYLTMWLALDDATVENGTIWVMPGSCRWGRITHRKREGHVSDMVGYDEHAPYQGVPVLARRGQLAVFSALTLHKSGTNVTDRPRRAWVMQYCVPGTCHPHTGHLYSTLALTRRWKPLMDKFVPLEQVRQTVWKREVIQGADVPADAIGQLGKTLAG